MKPSTGPKLIAIVGGSCAGKSRLAGLLQGLADGQAGRVSLDDFYLDRSHLSPRQRERINFDHPRAIDWPHFEHVLRTCLNGETASLPRYDFAKHVRLRGAEQLPPRPIILVDGLWLLRPPAIRRLFALKVFLDCSKRTRLGRRLRRDVAERARKVLEVRKAFHRLVVPMHRKFVAAQKRWADFVLSEKPGEAELRRLAERIWGLLSCRFQWPAGRREVFGAKLVALFGKGVPHEEPIHS